MAGLTRSSVEGERGEEEEAEKEKIFGNGGGKRKRKKRPRNLRSDAEERNSTNIRQSSDRSFIGITCAIRECI